MHMTRDPQYSEYEATPLHMIIRCASARMCGRPAQVSSASERPKGGAADHGEPPHGMHPHRVSASLWRKKKAASSQRQTTASGASNTALESAGRTTDTGYCNKSDARAPV